MALRKPDGDEQTQDGDLAANEAQIKAALIKLCKYIESFVHNPMIATPGTIDAKESTRARRDLEGIIETSDSVKKNSDRLKKTAP